MKLATNSFYNALGTVVPMVISIASVPLYMSEIGSERYGALLIAWLLLGYFGQADFGMARAITQRISAMRDGSPTLRANSLWSAICGVLIFSLISGLLVYAASSYFFAGPFKVSAQLRAEMMASRWILALCIPLIAVTGVFAGALMGLEHFRLVSASNMFSSIAMQLIPLAIATFVGKDLQGLIGAALAGRAIGLGFIVYGGWRTLLRGQKISVSRGEFVYLFRFGSWIMVTMIVSPLMTSADRFLIGALLGATAVAVYTVPFQVASRTVLLPLSVTQALFPRFASEEGEQSVQLCRDFSAFVGQLYAPVIIGLICLASPLLHAWIGSHLDFRSVLIGQIILVGFWTNAIAGVPYAQIQARGNPRFTALLHIAEMPIYVSLLYLLGHTNGLAGIAWAFTLRCAIDCVLLMVAGKVLHRSVVYRLAGPACLIALAFGAGRFFEGWIMTLAAAAILCGISCVLTLVQLPANIRERLLTLPVARRLLRQYHRVAKVTDIWCRNF